MYSNYNSMGNAFGAVFIIFILVCLAIGITIAVLYYLNLQNLLKEISPENREVEPGNVWLMFIPLFNLIYPFILYPRVCESVRREFEERGIPESGDYGRGMGITMPILSLTGWVPILGALGSIVNLILFIIFWVKMAGYKNTLRSTPKLKGNLSASIDILD